MLTADGEVLGWVAAQLDRYGLRLTGEVGPPRVRPWSTVLPVSTSGGSVWFKANAAGTVYEPRLLVALANWRVPHVLTPLAVDADRAWSVLPDGGTTLRETLARRLDLRHWERLLVDYAGLQRALAVRVPDLLALGVPDLRPAAMPARLGALLADGEALLLGRPGGMSEQTLTRLRGMEEEYAGWCARLEDSGVPPSLQHDDLHDGNVFVRAGGYAIFDWGDAAVAHPFGSLLVALRSIAARFGLPPGGAELRRLRDAYLEPWSDMRQPAELVEEAELAVRVATVGRALSWQRALVGASIEDRAEHADAVPGWLEELL